MPFNRQPVLTETDLHRIHQASMAILNRGGIAFHHDQVLALFKANGFKVSGAKVYFTEKEVLKALDTVPERFQLTARNQERSRWVGADDFVFVPTYGPSFIIETDGSQRPGTLADYEKAVKLNHTSELVDTLA